jgi:outer membrane protein TolC
MKSSFVVIAACSMLLGSTPARGQAPTALTLDEAITRGIEASHRLAKVEARRAASAALVEAREAADRPLVSLQAGYSFTNHVPAQFSHARVVEVKIRLDEGGRVADFIHPRVNVVIEPSSSNK